MNNNNVKPDSVILRVGSLIYQSCILAVTACRLGREARALVVLALAIAAQLPSLSQVTVSPSRLVNLSILSDVGTGDNRDFTLGFVISPGTTQVPILMRAVGPSLAAAPFNIGTALRDPFIELFAGSTKVSENDNWGGTAQLSAAMAQVGAFPLSAPNSLDSSILSSFRGGANSMRLSGVAGGTGTVIAEIYDATPSASVRDNTPGLANLSVLKEIGAGFTAGFVVSGSSSKSLLIRAVGPGLSSFGVAGAVADPQLELFNSTSASIALNDNWAFSDGVRIAAEAARLNASMSAVGAFPLTAGSKDAAMLVNVVPGAYTVQVKGVSGARGKTLLEVYDIPAANSPLSVSTSGATPGSVIRINGVGFDPKMPTTVRFTALSGQIIDFQAEVISASAIEVTAPFFIDMKTGNTSSQMVGMEVRQLSGTTTVSFGAIANFKIEDLPRSAAPLGAISLAYLNGLQGLYSSASADWLRLQTLSGGKVNSAKIVAGLSQMGQASTKAQTQLKTITSGTTPSFNIGVINGAAVNFDAQSLEMLDRIVLAYAFGEAEKKKYTKVDSIGASGRPTAANLDENIVIENPFNNLLNLTSEDFGQAARRVGRAALGVLVIAGTVVVVAEATPVVVGAVLVAKASTLVYAATVLAPAASSVTLQAGSKIITDRSSPLSSAIDNIDSDLNAIQFRLREFRDKIRSKLGSDQSAIDEIDTTPGEQELLTEMNSKDVDSAVSAALRDREALLPPAKSILTIRPTSFSRPYGSSNPALTYDFNGFLGGDTASVLGGAITLETPATQTSLPDDYKITISGRFSSAKYEIIYAEGTLTVTKATIEVTANPKTKVQGEPNPPLDGKIVLKNGDPSSALVGTPGISTTATTSSPAGVYPIIVSVAELQSDRYIFRAVNSTLTISPAGVVASNLPSPYTIPVSALGLKLIKIAPGSFAMGSTNGERDEEPVTQVTISQPYWLGATEVTQGQWEAVMGTNPSRFKGANLPVETVSYDEALAFCRKVTEQERAAGRLPEGYEYTLPTEAQWEYACRAGTTGNYAGNLDAMAWYIGNGGSTTHAVGGKQANGWGLYDMHGNVWEWCLDWYGNYAGGRVTDPRGASSGSNRVYRGGGWFNSASFCRAARRINGSPGGRVDDLGFRLALSSVR